MKQKKFSRWILRILVLLVVMILALVIYVKQFLPDVPLKDIKVEITSERIERGRYLANHVMVCMDCHSTRDWTKFAGPLVPGPKEGGERFDQAADAG
jgi:hypothetical protein